MVSSVSVGMVVAGRYTLERCINRGGLGSLWLVRDEQSDSPCGLRLGESSGQGVVELASRYLAEVDVVGRIRCENVVDILDYGEWNGMPFLVVEHVEGEALSAALVHGGSMPPKAAYRVVAQTARALARAHAAGIVHGDLTPEHILITSDGMQPMAKVFNFGLSQRGAEVGVTNATRIGSFLHLPYYSSPEQVSNRFTDWRSDLWSLAVICHECLVGRKPFDTSNFAELLSLITSDPLAPITLPGGRTPSALQSWWQKAMAKNPDERFQSAKELADALGKVFGFPLVFVPEPTTATLGPQASPASLPIVLRDSNAPQPTSSRPPARVVTPNPKLKSYGAPSMGRPMQVSVRASSPAPRSNGAAPGASRYTTQIGLGSVSPPNLMPKTSASSIPPSGANSADAPPSSLKVDVDVVPPSAGKVWHSGSSSVTQIAAPEEEETVNGFPLSEAPTVARKPPPEPARRVVLRGPSSDEPLLLASVPPKVRNRAAWLTAAAIVIVGTIGAARFVRLDKHPSAARATIAPRPTASVASVIQQNLPPIADAGQNMAASDDDDVSPVTAAQLQQKLAEELARVTAATDGAGAESVTQDRANRIGSKTAPKSIAPHTNRTPIRATDNPASSKPATESPGSSPSPANEAVPKKPTENKPKPANSVEREYGI